MGAVAADHHRQMDVAPAQSTSPAAAAAVRQRSGWLRRMYSPVGVAEREPAAAADDDGGGSARTKPRRGGGWMRRLVPAEHALRRRWKLLSGAPSRLAAGLPRWKRLSSFGAGGAGGCASGLLDAAAFRVMYVVEAVVLGLALSCFFCCCGCQI